MGAKATLGRSPAADLDDELAMDNPQSTAKRRKSHVVESMSRTVIEVTPAALKPMEGIPAKDLTLNEGLNKEVAAASEPVDRAFAQKIAAMLSTTPPEPPPRTVVQAMVEIPMSVVPKKQKTEGKEKAPNYETETLNSDELIVGLPKEQYKPRPSRSRSTRIAEDTSIDYSKCPEKVVASKLKRRKTTNEISLGSPPEKVDAEKMAQIGSMGFTPRQTKAALIESSGNIAQAVDNLIAQSSGGKENSPSKTSKTRSKSTRAPAASTNPSQFVTVQVTQGSGDKSFHPTVDEIQVPKHSIEDDQEKAKNHNDKIEIDSALLPQIKEDMPTKKPSAQKRRRDKVVDSDEEDDIAAEPEPSKPVLKPAAKRKLVDSDDDEDDFVIGPKSPKPAPKPTAKRTKSLPAKISRNAEEKDDLPAGNAAPTQPAKETKRGRGRPKKVVGAPVEIQLLEPLAAEPLKKTDKITPPKSPEPDKLAVGLEQAKEQIQNPISTPNKNGAVPLSTPEQHAGSTQKNVIVKGAPQHSPLNKNKVPLRVGLSRKKRIAPLLKIIKK
jgi:hypothetical protein